MTLYRSIFKQAFITAWQHKYLWFFGLFATMLASNFEIELVSRFLNREDTLFAWQKWTDTGIFSMQTIHNLSELARINTTSFISLVIFVLILLVLFVALIWISIVSQVALVSNTHKATGAKLSAADRRHDTSVGFQEGRRYFWPALGINVLVRVIVYGLAALTLLPVLFRTSPGIIDNLVYLVFFIVFLTIALSLALIAKYAVAALVIKRQPFSQAIASAWQLYWDNWLLSIEMAFILFAVSVAASLAIIIAVLVAAIPLALLYLLSYLIGNFVIYIILIILGILVSLGIIVIGGSFITVVQTSAWVALYNQLTGRTPVVSKLERTFGDK